MTIRKTTRHLQAIATSLVLVIILFLNSCTPEITDDQIGFIPFDDQYINLSLPAYQALSLDGGFVYLNSIGVHGVILYRKSASQYLAFERNCSFEPANACATVDVDVSQLFMKDSCCGSTFNFSDGAPTGGPAWRNLRQYTTSLNGSTLVVTDAILQ